jgi:SnoaL-like polyketide cyclase
LILPSRNCAQVIGEGDTVVVHATHLAHHTGDLMGIPPTDREVAYDYVHIVRFQESKVVEHWGVRNDLTLLRQLGVLPDPAAARGRIPTAVGAGNAGGVMDRTPDRTNTPGAAFKRQDRDVSRTTKGQQRAGWRPAAIPRDGRAPIQRR